MEGKSKWRTSKALPLPLQRYFVYRQQAPDLPRKVLWLLELLGTVQIATLLQPPEALDGDPWDFKRFWPLWYLLNAFSRGDRMLFLTNLAPIQLAYAGWVLLSLRFASFLLLSTGLARLSRSDYLQLLGRTQRKAWLRTLELLDLLLSLLVTKAASVPLAACYAVLLGGQDSEISPGELIAVALSLPVVVISISFERVNLCDLHFSHSSLGPCKPAYQLLFTLCDLLAASFISLSQALKHDFLLRSVAILCGGAKTCCIYIFLPYHQSLKNTIDSFQGLMLVYQAVLLTLGSAYNGTTATLCYLLVTPGLFYLSRSMVLYLENRLKTALFLTSEVHFDYMLRQKSLPTHPSEATEPSELLQSPLFPLPIDRMPLYPLLWTAYYYQTQRNVFAMKLAIALISAQKVPWLGCLAAEVAVLRLRVAIEANKEEEIVQNFLTLHRTQEKIKSEDLVVCIRLKELYLTLKQPHVAYSRLATQMPRIQAQIQHVLHVYKQSIRKFSKKVSLLQSYQSLLVLIGRNKKAAEVQTRISQVSEAQKHDKGLGVERLLMEDEKCLILVVPLTGPSASHISWSVNSKLLDYTEEGLKGLDFHILLPACFRSTHKQLMTGLMQHQTLPRMFQGSSPMYLVDSKGRLIYGAWQLFLANERPSGELVVVATLKVEACAKDFCIISANYEPLEMTLGFSLFQQAHQDLFSLLNVASPELLWSGMWENSRYLLSREQWTFFNRFHIPIITLNKFRGRVGSRFSNKTPSLKQEKQRKVSFSGTNRDLEKLFIMNSKKSNSSFGSNFTSSEGFISFTVKKSLRRQRIFSWLIAFILLLVLVLSLAISGSVLAIAIHQINDLNSDLSEMNAIGIRRFLSVTSAMRSKELYLVSNGFKVIGNETRARADLVTVATLMKQMSLNVLGNASKAEGYYHTLVHDPVLPFWLYEGSSYHLNSYTLSDLMALIASYSAALNLTSLANVTAENSHFRSLYRSGAAEGLQDFNHTIDAYTANIQNNHIQDTALIELLLVVVFTIEAAVGGLFAFILLYLTERYRAQLWRVLTNLPKAIFAQAISEVTERLENMHEFNISFQDLSRDQAASHYTASPLFKTLAVAIALFLLFTSLYVLHIHAVGVLGVSDILDHKPLVINWSGLRRAITQFTVFNMREAWLLGSNSSYSGLVPEHQYLSNPLLYMEKGYMELAYIHKSLIYGNTQANTSRLQPSKEHKDLLMGTACVANQACDTLVKAGLAPLINEVLMLFANTKAALQRGETDYASNGGKKTEKTVGVLMPYLSTLVQKYDSDTLDDLQKSQSTATFLCGLYGSFSVLLFACLLVPLLLWNLRKLTQETKVLSYLPSEPLAVALSQALAR